MSQAEQTTGPGSQGLGQGIESCVDQMRQLSESHPDWFALYDDAQFDLGMSKADMLTLLDSAPNGFAAGVIFGKLMIRQQISILTERPF